MDMIWATERGQERFFGTLPTPCCLNEAMQRVRVGLSNHSDTSLD